MKFLIIIFSFALVLNATHILAGNNTDSLLTVYKNETNEKSKTLLLLKIAESFSTSNIDTVILICRQAKVKAENLRDDSLQLVCCRYLVSAYTSKPYSVDSALLYIPLIEKLIHENNNPVLSFLTWTKVGDAYKELHQYPDATVYYQKAVDAALLTNETDKICSAKNNLGEIYRKSSLFDRAMDVFNEVAILAVKDNNLKNTIGAYRGIGICYDLKKDYDNAAKYFEMALDASLKDKEEKTAYAHYGNYAVALGHLKKYDEAIASVKKAVELGLKYRPQDLQTDYKNLAELYMNKGDLDSSIYYCNLSMAIAEKSNQQIMQAIVHRLLADVYKLKGHYEEAFIHLDKSKIISDSLNSKAREKTVAEMEAVYGNKEKKVRIQLLDKENDIKALTLQQKEIALREAGVKATQKETEIALLNKTKDFQELKLSKTQQELVAQMLQSKAQKANLELEKKDKALKEEQLVKEKLYRNLIIGGSLALIFISLLLFNRYRLNKRLEQQTVLINHRKQISADLHDDIGSTLSSISIYSEAMKNKYKAGDYDKAMQLAEEIGNNSREMMENMSDIVWSINPGKDDLQQISNRMQSVATNLLSQKDIATEFLMDDKLSTVLIPMQARKNIYLIFKEAINNIAKYAQCKNVTVEFLNQNNNLILKIRDDGNGFDTDAQKNASRNNLGGNGLKNMQLRADEINGVLKINSVLNKGTEIILTYPLVR